MSGIEELFPGQYKISISSSSIRFESHFILLKNTHGDIQEQKHIHEHMTKPRADKKPKGNTQAHTETARRYRTHGAWGTQGNKYEHRGTQKTTQSHGGTLRKRHMTAQEHKDMQACHLEHPGPSRNTQKDRGADRKTRDTQDPGARRRIRSLRYLRTQRHTQEEKRISRSTWVYMRRPRNSSGAQEHTESWLETSSSIAVRWLPAVDAVCGERGRSRIMVADAMPVTRIRNALGALH